MQAPCGALAERGVKQQNFRAAAAAKAAILLTTREHVHHFEFFSRS
jgi:hypothetical protein